MCLGGKDVSRRLSEAATEILVNVLKPMLASYRTALQKADSCHGLEPWVGLRAGMLALMQSQAAVITDALHRAQIEIIHAVTCRA